MPQKHPRTPATKGGQGSAAVVSGRAKGGRGGRGGEGVKGGGVRGREGGHRPANKIFTTTSLLHQ